MSLLVKQKKRILPGPAGQLLNVSRLKNITNPQQSTSLTVKEKSDTDFLDSQEMWQRIRGYSDNETWSLANRFNIRTILKMASEVGGFPRGKIPVLCALIDKLDTFLPDVKAVLGDSTGSIGCTIERSVMRCYKSYLTPGAILLLKEVSLYSINRKTFYLNITHSNIVRLYLGESTNHVGNVSSMPSNVFVEKSLYKHQIPIAFTAKDLAEIVAECLNPPSPSTNPHMDKKICITSQSSTSRSVVNLDTDHSNVQISFDTPSIVESNKEKSDKFCRLKNEQLEEPSKSPRILSFPLKKRGLKSLLGTPIPSKIPPSESPLCCESVTLNDSSTPNPLEDGMDAFLAGITDI